MADYMPKEGTGSIFKNGYKDKESQPDWRGDALYKGELLEIAAWENKTQSGKPYFKLNIQPKRERPQADSGAAYRAQKDGGPKPDLDGDIPF